MKIIAGLLAVIISSSLYAGDKRMSDIPGKIITIEQLDQMFENIRENTDWDISGDMLWGYFFTHHEPTKLEEANNALVEKGYRFVDIFLSDKDEPKDPDMFWLHVERIETHTSATLDERNDELYKFAHEFGLDSYDGMDVGPVGN